MPLNRLIKDINLGARKLARTHALLEEQIHLRKRAPLRLGNPEVRVDDTQEADAAPEEAGEVAPVPGAGVEHVGGEHAADYRDDVVQVAAEDHGFDLQAAGGELGDERVGHCADRELVEERPDDHHAASCERGLVFVCLRNEAQEAHYQEHGAEAAEAVEVQGSAADAEGHEEPGAEDADHVDAVLAHGEGVGFRGGEAGLFEEVGRVVGEGVAAKVLDGPDHADDLGSAEVGPLEAVEVAGPGCDLLFQRGGVHHHGDCLVGVEVCLPV